MKNQNLLIKFKQVFMLLCMVLVLSAAKGQHLVGYAPSWSTNPNTVQYNKLTHVVYAFIRPTASGGYTAIDQPGKLQSIVSQAHANGAKVSIAVGGWSDLNNTDFEAMSSSSTSRNTFANSMLSLCNQYNLDGVDIDWEYPTTAQSSNYAAMMQALADKLHGAGKILTAAVPATSYYGQGIPSAAFSSVDFLNLMAYDGDAGAGHSPYSLAVQTFDYWLGRGLPASKAVLGVPFYSRPGWQSYSALLANGASPNSDYYNGEYYNGIPTIQQKTDLAKQRGNGIMIWEISQDASGSNSLLSAIYARMGGGNCNSTSITPYIQVNGGTWQQTSNVSVDKGSTVMFGPQPSSGGSWSWSGPNGFSSSSREVTISNIQSSQAGTYTATYKNSCGATSSHGFSVTVNGTNPGGCDGLPAYPDGIGSYQAGDHVSHNGGIYEVKPWPYTGWANTLHPAYEPGVGWAWQDAWIYVGPCSGARTSVESDLIQAELKNIVIKPNPAVSAIQLEGIKDRALVEIVSVDGKVMLSTEGFESQAIDISEFPSGVYLVRFTSREGNVAIRRLIKRN